MSKKTRVLAPDNDMALCRATAERQRESRQRWLEAMLNCIGDGVIATDADNKVTYMNSVAEFLTGWKKEDALGCGLSQVFHTVDAENRGADEDREIRALRSDTAFLEESDDLLLLSADGSVRPVWSTVSPINDADRNLLGVIIVFHDITGRRQIERRNLEKKKMEAIGRMGRTVAHEFNNLVTVIAGNASSMLDYLMPDNRAYADTRQILAATDYARKLIKRILGVARASDVESDIAIGPVSLADAVQSAAALIHDPFKEKGIKVEVNGVRGMPAVMADASQMVDLLMDVFLNAADAMPKGGVLSIEARRQNVIRPDTRLNPKAKPGPYAVLRIRDTGYGMTAEVLDHIFEPFYTTKATDLHVGLGLSVVQSAVHRYGGWIKVSSEPGHGTTLSLFIPEARKGRRAATQAGAIAGATVLLADDDSALRKTLQTALEQAGFKKVLAAADGTEAIRLFKRDPEAVAVSVVDMIMPEKDGSAVLQEIYKVNPAALVVVTSGLSRDYARSCLARGTWKFIQKPFEPEQFLGVVRRSLEPKAP